jgi:hypothetical protein
MMDRIELDPILWKRPNYDFYLILFYFILGGGGDSEACFVRFGLFLPALLLLPSELVRQRTGMSRIHIVALIAFSKW